ncbi:citrulline utilization hydrolase CtlX [Adhaeribacter aquaticus]|uniref:citrulline utilization hydrolase CtlX n=1 Tax=Adhaeribacter aquaticus TaxID=299567 RepID=UPI000409FF06|nr:arginine deiminase-related protein [Adhaeribacter aquaticus]
MHTTSALLMVRPSSFAYNTQTAASNAFQQELQELTPEQIRLNALAEFDKFVALLRAKGIQVLVIDDTQAPEKPDAIFPNNWITMHQNGTIALYPMHAPNRRMERRQDILDLLKQHYQVNHLIDFSLFEKEDKFLEGTGSIILDHENQFAYACISPRTDLVLLHIFCDTFKYKPIAFHAYDQHSVLIYHTNVMLCIGSQFAVICSEAIHDPEERRLVLDNLSRTGHELVEITLDQLSRFAGNMLQVHNHEGKHFLIMSEQAYKALNPKQIENIEKYTEILATPLYTIEHIGGGSARCMLAEIFLPKK